MRDISIGSIAALSVLLLCACGDDSASAVCAVGETQACVGPGGCAGGQTCLPDRSGWAPCDCGGADASVDADSRDVGAEDTGADAGLDGGADVGADAGCVESDSADVLFVIDPVNTAIEEQAALAAAMPILVSRLVTGDLDGDGTPELAGLDLQFGVISSDLGVGNDSTPTCSLVGDDGVLLTRGAGAGCSATLPAIQIATDAADTDVACLVQGVGFGCGFPQSLDSALKALTESTSATRFAGDTTGHADVANDGFRRPGVPLGIIVLSLRDDCSSADLDVFAQTGPYADVPLNQRCLESDALHELTRYSTSAFGDPTRIVFGIATGLPDGVSLVEGADLEALATDDRLDPSRVDGTGIADVCTGSGGGAQPGQRLVRAAAAWSADAAGVVVDTVCQDSFEPLVGRFAELLLRTARCEP